MATEGAAGTTLRRSTRGIAVGTLVMALIFGGLIAWNLFGRGGQKGLIGAAIVAIVMVPAGAVYLRGPRRIEISDEGLLVRPFIGRARPVAWDDIESARLWTAPLGRRPTVASLQLRQDFKLEPSEAEYHTITPLIAALFEHAADRIEDDRKG